MKNLSVIASFVSLLMLPNALHAQEYPRLNGVILTFQISYDSPRGMFYYTYVVTNNNSSVGSVMAFTIDDEMGSNSFALDTIGLKFRNDGFTESLFRQRYPELIGRIVPVGFPSSPGIWIGSITSYLEIEFHGDSRMLINHGKILGDFVVMSRGLPGIRQFTASPRFDPTQYLPDPDEYPDSAVDMDSVNHMINYYGWTIGPTAPPSNFDCSSWLDTLSSYTNQSLSLGWIKDQATATWII